MLCRFDPSSLRRMSLKFKTENCKTFIISRNDFSVQIAFYRKHKHLLRKIINGWVETVSNFLKRRHLVYDDYAPTVTYLVRQGSVEHWPHTRNLFYRTKLNFYKWFIDRIVKLTCRNCKKIHKTLSLSNWHPVTSSQISTRAAQCHHHCFCE